jgi:hypothetical protein
MTAEREPLYRRGRQATGNVGPTNLWSTNTKAEHRSSVQLRVDSSIREAARQSAASAADHTAVSRLLLLSEAALDVTAAPVSSSAVQQHAIVIVLNIDRFPSRK